MAPLYQSFSFHAALSAYTVHYNCVVSLLTAFNKKSRRLALLTPKVLPRRHLTHLTHRPGAQERKATQTLFTFEF